jgi:tetratricopeptide (TPR) repeat protein
MDSLEKIVEQARLAFICDKPEEAEKWCRAGLERSQDLADALLVLVCLRLRSGLFAEATKIICRVIGRSDLLSPESVAQNPLLLAESYRKENASGLNRTAVNFNEGLIYLSCLQYEKAADRFRKALQSNPLHLPAHQALAASILVGSHYLEILQELHTWYKPRGYLEIGVSTGKSLVLAQPPTVCVGVDPQPQMKFIPTAPTRIFPVTSDSFFEKQTVSPVLGNNPVDMAFIDGLHLFEQVLKDFVNVEKHADRNSIIVLHDSFPIDYVSASRDRVSSFWSGDVWKALLCIKEKRPDLGLIVIKAKPTGLALITGCDPASTLLRENFDSVIAEYIDLLYDDFVARAAAIETGNSTWSLVREWLEKQGVRPCR